MESNDTQAVDDTVEPYEAPQVVILGTISGLTAGAANLGGDLVFS